MKSITELKMGMLISATQAFDRKATHRFQNPAWEWNNSTIPFYCQSPSPCCKDFQGMIVGKRNVIMSEYKHHTGSNHEEPEPAYATGKYKQVLLVCKNERSEPLIVQAEDVI